MTKENNWITPTSFLLGAFMIAASVRVVGEDIMRTIRATNNESIMELQTINRNINDYKKLHLEAMDKQTKEIYNQGNSTRDTLDGLKRTIEYK